MSELEIEDTALSDIEKAMRDRWGTGVALPSSSDVTPEPAGGGDGDLTPSPREDDDEPNDEPEQGSDSGDDEQEPEPSSSPDNPPIPEPPVPSDLIDLGDGRRLTRQQIESYLQFEDRLRADPGLFEYLKSYGQSPEPPKPPEPPAIDLDDPNIAYLYQQNQQLQEQLKALGAGVQAQQAQSLAEREAQLRALAERAAKSFQSEHKLNDDEIQKVRTVAANINAIDTYMQGKHPLTGQQVDPDVLSAMDVALTIAYRSMPEFDERRHTLAVQTQLNNKNRKKKLAKVGANSGSVPRTPPPAGNKQELRQQFVDEVRGIMFGSQS